MAIEARVHFFCDRASQIRKAVLPPVKKAGIRVHEGDDTATIASILFFDRFGDDLIRAVRNISRHGDYRLLAVPMYQSAPAPEKIWSLLQAGASDVVPWHHGVDMSVQITARIKRWNSIEQLLLSATVKDNLIGNSAMWRSAMRNLIEAARFTQNAVLILGESGTGKELAARLIHTLDPREDKQKLVVVDCTTIAPDLAGSELFGHERGAYTGAVQGRDGAFALANRGTLFLDEIGELPIPLQAQLLRVLQEHTYKRIGGNNWQSTKFRLVCATNRDLRREVDAGQFRADLYYRIADWECWLPPLRQRSEDVLPLAEHFLEEDDTAPLQLDDAVREYLLRRRYPGNVRELEQLISRMRSRHAGNGAISVGDIPDCERLLEEVSEDDWRDDQFDQAIRRALILGAGLKDIDQYATSTAIRIAVNDEQGNLQRAARRLGVTDRALQMRRANGLL